MPDSIRSYARRVGRSLLVTFLCCGLSMAQDASESLGPKDSGNKAASTPLVAEMNSLNSKLKPELIGVHPRVYFDKDELSIIRAKAHGPQKAWWQAQLQHLRVLQGDPPAPPAGETPRTKRSRASDC